MRLALIVCIFCVAACAAPQTEQIKKPATEIYWTDGDSGRIDGKDFRLSNIDAPETGGVGAAIGGSECERERELGFQAKAFMVELTRDADLEITASYGLDKYDREVIDLSADGVDVSQAGIDAGVIKPWPHKERRQLQPKPDWCAE